MYDSMCTKLGSFIHIWWYPGDVRLVPSGTYCMPQMYVWPGIVFFYVSGILVMGCILIWRYLGLYLFLRNFETNTVSHNKKRFALKMTLFVVTYLVLWFPVICGSIYEWIFWKTAAGDNKCGF